MSVKYITNIVFTPQQLSRRLSLFINATVKNLCIFLGFAIGICFNFTLYSAFKLLFECIYTKYFVSNLF